MLSLLADHTLFTTGNNSYRQHKWNQPILAAAAPSNCPTVTYTYNPLLGKKKCQFKYDCQNVCQTVNKPQCTTTQKYKCTTYKRRKCKVIQQTVCDPNDNNRVKREAAASGNRQKRTIGALIEAKKKFWQQIWGTFQSKPAIATSNHKPSYPSTNPNYPPPPSPPPPSHPGQNEIQDPNCQVKNKKVCVWVPYKEVCSSRPVQNCVNKPVEECKKKCQNKWICNECNNNNLEQEEVTPGPPAPPTGTVITRPTIRPTNRPPGPPAPPTGTIITRPTVKPTRPTTRPTRTTVKPTRPTTRPTRPTRPTTRPTRPTRPTTRPTRPTRPTTRPTRPPGPPGIPVGGVVRPPSPPNRPGPPSPPNNFIVRPPSAPRPPAFQVIEAKDSSKKKQKRIRSKGKRKRRRRRRKKKLTGATTKLSQRRGKRSEVKLPVGPPPFHL